MPPKAADREGKLQPVSFRVTPDLRSRLEEAASTSGRSLTAEIERRLEQSFIWEANFTDAKNMINKYRDFATAELSQVLKTEGFTRIRGIGGIYWQEPGGDEGDPDKLSLANALEHGVKRAVAEALAEAGIGGGKPK